MLFQSVIVLAILAKCSLADGYAYFYPTPEATGIPQVYSAGCRMYHLVNLSIALY
jgi:hypothetical protein